VARVETRTSDGRRFRLRDISEKDGGKARRKGLRMGMSGICERYSVQDTDICLIEE